MPVLSWTGTRFVYVCNPYDNNIPKTLGFHYDPHNKLWWTGLISVAKGVEKWSDAKAKAKFCEESDIVKQSWATDAALNIPVPDGIDPLTGKPFAYLPFQKAGIAYTARRGRTLNADEMGLGKTVQGLGVINLFPEIKNVLIIPPAGLRLNWAKEAKKWLVRPMSGGFASGSHFPDTNIVIINYDIVDRFRSQIDARRWDLLICDEAHYLKNPETKRTGVVMGYDYFGKPMRPAIDAGMKIYLTGTPILSRPIELWPIVHDCDPNGLGTDQWLFAERYCKPWQTPWGTVDFSGDDNLDELQERLRSTFMVRRLKQDVLTELPPKRRQIIAIPQESASAAVKEELEFYLQHQQEIDRAVAEAEMHQAAGDEESYRKAVRKLEGETPTFATMSRLRKKVGLAKIPFIKEFLNDVLQQEEKVVVFAHHRDVVDEIYQHLGPKIAVKMHGDNTTQERQRAVDRFQQDKNIRVIIGTIGTMKEGWTLTRAAYCLFCELDWVPSVISQSEDRLHRITQVLPVLVHHFCFDGSLDAYMAQVIVRKQIIIDQALNTRRVVTQ